MFLCCGHLKAQELLLVDASSHPQTIKGKHLGMVSVLVLEEIYLAPNDGESMGRPL